MLEVMSKAWWLLLPVVGVVCILAAKRLRTVAARKAMTNKGEEFKPVIAVAPPGFRRALGSEVTQPMSEAAVEALHGSEPLGTILSHDRFAVALEHHYDEIRGWHRGASIFVKGT